MGYLSIPDPINRSQSNLTGMNIEHFKGIEFVRISAMPKDQQERVWESFERDKIFKIVTDQSLLNDCILYNDYAAWEALQRGGNGLKTESAIPLKGSFGRLAS